MSFELVVPALKFPTIFKGVVCSQRLIAVHPVPIIPVYFDPVFFHRFFFESFFITNEQTENENKNVFHSDELKAEAGG